jgi:hypothetical protein
VLPGGESYAQLQVRVRGWYESLERDSVVSAHGGVCRALIAHLNLAKPEAASTGDIGQGCVYVSMATVWRAIRSAEKQERPDFRPAPLQRNPAWAFRLKERMHLLRESASVQLGLLRRLFSSSSSSWP